MVRYSERGGGLCSNSISRMVIGSCSPGQRHAAHRIAIADHAHTTSRRADGENGQGLHRHRAWLRLWRQPGVAATGIESAIDTGVREALPEPTSRIVLF